jgi:hypothetical protein
MNKQQCLEKDPAFSVICNAVAKGKIVLFVGAGVHASPDPPEDFPWKYDKAQRPLFAPELAEKLASKSGWSVRFNTANYPPSQHFNRVALDYELNIENDVARIKDKLPPLLSYAVRDADEAKLLREKGRVSLGNVVRAGVESGKQPSPALRGLAELNFPVIVTTNYDSLFWDALLSVSKEPTTAYYIRNRSGADADPADEPSIEKPFLFKIHGCASNPASMVVTDEDYIDFVLHMSTTGPLNPVPETVYIAMRLWPTLFLGYRFQDFNLRLLLKTLRHGKLRFKTGYCVDPSPDSLIKRVWDDELKFVNFLVEDLWTFVPALYKRVKGKDMPL